MENKIDVKNISSITKYSITTINSNPLRRFFMKINLLREGADAVDFKTQTKIKIYSFNLKDPSLKFVS